MINKYKILLLSIFFVNLCFFPSSVYSVDFNDPNAQRVIQDQRCGNAAGITEQARQCCTVDVKSSYEKENNAAASVVPGGIRDLFSSLLTFALPILQDNTFISIMTQPCFNGVPEGTGSSCKCVPPAKDAPNADSTQSLSALCESNINQANAKTPEEKKRLEDDRNACLKCSINEGGYYSDFGCIPGDLAGFVSNFVLRIGIGIAGFISLMCIIYSSFLLQVSRGNPEMLTKAREQVTSCIIGLIMIIFSVFILRLIGVDILRIPGFS